MGNIGVYLTDRKKIFVVSYASSLPTLLGDDTVKENWFYNKPPELVKFFKENREEEGLFDQALAYWVICKVFQQEQNETAYGMLKRKLSEFSKNLLSTVRNLVEAVVSDIKYFWHQQERRAKKMFESNNLRFPKKKSYRKKIINQY